MNTGWSIAKILNTNYLQTLRVYRCLWELWADCSK